MEAVVIAANENDFYALIPNKAKHKCFGIQCYDLYSSCSKKFLKPKDDQYYHYSIYIQKIRKNFCCKEQNELFNTVKNMPECYKEFKLIKLSKMHSTWYAAYTDNFEKIMEGLK